MTQASGSVAVRTWTLTDNGFKLDSWVYTAELVCLVPLLALPSAGLCQAIEETRSHTDHCVCMQPRQARPRALTYQPKSPGRPLAMSEPSRRQSTTLLGFRLLLPLFICSGAASEHLEAPKTRGWDSRAVKRRRVSSLVFASLMPGQLEPQKSRGPRKRLL